MKKVCLLLFLLLFICSNPYISDDVDYYCDDFNQFSKWFTEPVEYAYFFWLDGTVVRFTSYEWNTVSCAPIEAVVEITKRGYDIKSCFFIIHNHLLPAGFSEPDRRFYRGIKKTGFQGLFLLYTDRGVFMLRDNDGLD